MTGIVDDDAAEIEAEIQRELEAISQDKLEIEDDEDENFSVSPYYFNGKNDEPLPASLEEYFRAIHSRTECVEKEVNECDEILRKTDGLCNEEEILERKIKEALGDDCHDNPLDIRNKVLLEIEEAEQNEKKGKIRQASGDNEMTLDIIRTDISDQIRKLEEQAEQQLKVLEEKQRLKSQQRTDLYDNIKREENERMGKETLARKQRQEELALAQTLLNQNQKVLEDKLEIEAKQGEEKLKLLAQQFQAEIKDMEEQSSREKKALEDMRLHEAQYQHNKCTMAAVKIQKTYRGHRTYIQYKEILQQKQEDRWKKMEEELEKQYEMEKKIREEMDKKQEEELNRKEKELLEKKKRKQKEEEWRKEIEEQNRKDEEKKKENERRKLEKEEMRRKEEVRRKELETLEHRKKEEERKKIDEEKKRIEAEKKMREEEQKRMKEEEKQKEIAKQKKEEQKRMEEEEKQKEIVRKKEEEQKRIEEEKLTERRREFEENERKKIEMEARMRLEIEKQKLEEKERMVRKKKEDESEKQRLNVEKRNIDEEKKEIEKQSNSQTSIHIRLTHSLEEKRLQWIKEHTPYSLSTFDDRVQPVATRSKPRSRQRSRRPFSASRSLPSLTEDQIIQASPPATPLHKVIRVCLRSCAACNMLGLKSCPCLKSLTMENCGLMAVEGLEECKDLQELRAQNNKIEYINCRDLHNLEEISLSGNSLTSIHGLEGCTQLRHLDLTNNKITRLGDLSSCPNLQQLCLDNNQLIMTKGLSNLKNLHSLSCANNHLPQVKEIDSCQSLQYLNLQGNNLQRPPLLNDHVLLRELILDDNSISTLEPLAHAWLPSLHLLSVSQNSISNIDSLEGLVMLQNLDVSHNLISDLDSLIPGLCECRGLQILKITGNPVNEEPQCRHLVSKALEFLTQLDDEVLQPKTSTIPCQAPFILMCHKQLTAYNDLKTRHKNQLSLFAGSMEDPINVIKELNIKSKQFVELHQLAVAQLQEHEVFGLELVQEHVQQELKETHGTPLSVKERKPDNNKQTTICHQESTPVTGKSAQGDAVNRHAAAVRIQSVWRGWYIRHLIDVQMRRWLSAVIIQALWRGYSVRSRNINSRVSRAGKALWDARHHSAATIIQACYRGYVVRHRLAKALQAVQYHDDDDDDDGFDYDEEVDLSAFDFDSGAIDEGWTPTDTPQLPSRGPVLPMAGQSSVIPTKSKPSDTRVPRQAWRSADSPMEHTSTANQRRAINQQSPEQDLMSVTSGTHSQLTHGAEELSNEWGVKNVSTAELMWKRANRMKYNPARKRKLLDPNKRLALFKKLDEANKLRDVKPPARTQRVDYFTAHDSSILQSGSSTPSSERDSKARMTYSWVHSQGVVHEDQEGGYMSTMDYETKPHKPLPRKSVKSVSPVSLPHMDPVLLAGRNIPLVSSPALIREQMAKNASQPTSRHSSATEEIRFPSIKTHSVPNLAARPAVSRSSSRSNEKSNSAGARMTKQRKR